MLNVYLDQPRLERLLRGGVVVTLPATVFRITGSGAADCLQGLLTNDLVGPGLGRMTYTALLTPKGMVVVDLWLAHLGTEILLIGPPEGHGPAMEIFKRSLPPRLAKLADLSDAWRVAWTYGDRAEAALLEAHLNPGADGPGQVARLPVESQGVVVASGTGTTPFRSLLAGPEEALTDATNLLLDHGMTEGDQDDHHAARILAGWPALGFEIGDKTLLQEVRLEELEGVSFTKGCFLGQETVARIHFRGRTQRVLRGLDWLDLQPLEGTEVRNADRALGQVHSVLALTDRRLGLAMVRREADLGDAVLAGGREARIVPLPFDPPDRAA